MIENYFNIIHYCLYKFHFKLHLIFDKINPANFLLNIPFIQKRLEKKGLKDHKKLYNNTFSNKKYGLSVVFAGGILWGLIGIFFFSFLIVFNLPTTTVYILICVLVSTFVAYKYVLKEDKYIAYFDKFEKSSKREKNKYYSLTFFSILFVIGLFFLGFLT